MAQYKLTSNGYYDRINNLYIPNDPGNKDYQTVQVWIAAGNTPDPQYTAAQLAAIKQQDQINAIDSTFAAVQAQPVDCTCGDIVYKMDGSYEAVIKMNNGIQFAQMSALTELTIVDFDNLIHPGVPIEDCQLILKQQAEYYYTAYMNRAIARAAVLKST